MKKQSFKWGIALLALLVGIAIGVSATSIIYTVRENQDWTLSAGLPLGTVKEIRQDEATQHSIAVIEVANPFHGNEREVYEIPLITEEEAQNWYGKDAQIDWDKLKNLPTEKELACIYLVAHFPDKDSAYTSGMVWDWLLRADFVKESLRIYDVQVDFE